MNEDEHGITPANVTAMTLQPCNGGWQVVIEQGNGDVLKDIQLTSMERAQLGVLLGMDTPLTASHIEFVDFSR